MSQTLSQLRPPLVPKTLTTDKATNDLRVHHVDEAAPAPVPLSSQMRLAKACLLDQPGRWAPTASAAIKECLEWAVTNDVSAHLFEDDCFINLWRGNRKTLGYWNLPDVDAERRFLVTEWSAGKPSFTLGHATPRSVGLHTPQDYCFAFHMSAAVARAAGELGSINSSVDVFLECDVNDVIATPDKVLPNLLKLSNRLFKELSSLPSKTLKALPYSSIIYFGQPKIGIREQGNILDIKATAALVRLLREFCEISGPFKAARVSITHPTKEW